MLVRETNENPEHDLVTNLATRGPFWLQADTDDAPSGSRRSTPDLAPNDADIDDRLGPLSTTASIESNAISPDLWAAGL